MGVIQSTAVILDCCDTVNPCDDDCATAAAAVMSAAEYRDHPFNATFQQH